jgi:hypothetical protein
MIGESFWYLKQSTVKVKPGEYEELLESEVSIEVRLVGNGFGRQ